MQPKLFEERIPLDYEEWTMSHGFFAIMGGFMFYKDKKPLRTFSPEDLNAYFPKRSGTSSDLKGKIDILEEEINDRSKGDFLSKAIAIGRAVWFAVRYIARGMEQLLLTDLELVTLAFTCDLVRDLVVQSTAKAIWNATWNTIWHATYNLIQPTHDHLTLEGVEWICVP
jgi:hypothetical protein